MSLTCTWTQSVFGDRRVAFGTVTVAGLTSGAIQTPLSVIQGGSVTIQSAASAVPGFIPGFNLSSANSALNGYVRIATCTAGDTFNVFVFGE